MPHIPVVPKLAPLHPRPPSDAPQTPLETRPAGIGRSLVPRLNMRTHDVDPARVCEFLFGKEAARDAGNVVSAARTAGG